MQELIRQLFLFQVIAFLLLLVVAFITITNKHQIKRYHERVAYELNNILRKFK
jgi:hypothetical protein